MLYKKSDTLEEFRKIARKHVEDYKNKCDETIKQLLKTIDSCDKSLELLK